ncbi:hypothetical protein ATCR1_18680 [Agrobacterium tumefaciens CCNWGS0286]|nr:hypothetical protein ATCR1_18680 [Agrobacterium tumefaciens CCNWGS0286]EPR22130.1 hypothetical protein L902_24095 [Agrobacterium radiobacter DSM 30147]
MRPAVIGDDVERQPRGQGRFSLSFVMPRLDNGVQPRRVCAVKEHSAIKDVIALDL